MLLDYCTVDGLPSLYLRCTLQYKQTHSSRFFLYLPFHPISTPPSTVSTHALCHHQQSKLKGASHHFHSHLSIYTYTNPRQY